MTASILHWSRCFFVHPQIVKAACEVDRATSDDGTTPLLQAATQGFSDIISVLIEHRADVDKARDEYIIAHACHHIGPARTIRGIVWGDMSGIFFFVFSIRPSPNVQK